MDIEEIHKDMMKYQEDNLAKAIRVFKAIIIIQFLFIMLLILYI